MVDGPFTTPREDIPPSPGVADEIRTTTCYMCACRCGIRVYLKDGRVKYIDGNPDHPVNKGVLCAKGSAGIMQHLSPARLKKPLLRKGPRGSGEFREIEWDEALALATQWMSEVRNRDPRKLAFFTGRDQSQSLTGWWASQFGTPNYAAHGGFCSVNMAAAGLYTIGGSFWEFGEPDWEDARYFMLFGVAEDHDSNPIKAGLGRLRATGQAKIVSINPVRTGYSAVADEWVGIRPGTDGLFIAGLIRELLAAGQIDWEYLRLKTNAAHLIVEDPGSGTNGLVARDEAGRPLVWDNNAQAVCPGPHPDVAAALKGEFVLPDGRRARPAFELFARRYLSDDYDPRKTEATTGVPAATVRRIAAELAEAAFESDVAVDTPWTDAWGRNHKRFEGRPVAIHAMRGISAHANGFMTCRMLHHLQMVLGAVDRPGAFRYRPPFPKPLPPAPKPHGGDGTPNQPLAGPPIGNPTGPEDLLVDENGRPTRIDKAYSWENPLSIHGLLHMMLHNTWAGDPYSIDVLFLYMANMAWNSAMNIPATLKYLTDTDPDTGDYKIKRIIYSDAFYSETVPYADLILPDTTYLERWDCISLLDRPISSAEAARDSIRQPVVTPDRDVRPFQDMLIDLGYRLGLPGMTTDGGEPCYPGGYADYLVNHQRAPGVGPLAGWRGEAGNSHGRGAPNAEQLQRYIENGCSWSGPLATEALYEKTVNAAYLSHAHEMGWIGSEEPIFANLYDETMQKFRLAAEGHGPSRPSAAQKERIATYFDPLPFWYPPFEKAGAEKDDFPLSAVTQRPAHMYHSWGGMNAWLRQITDRNALFMHEETASDLGLADGDVVAVTSRNGKIKARLKTMRGVNRWTVWTWNAIGKRKGAWALGPKAPEAEKGFLLNHLIDDLLPPREDGYRYANADPITGQAAWFDLRVRVEKWRTEDAKDVAGYPAMKGPRAGPQDLRFGADKKSTHSSREAAELHEFIPHSERDA